MRLEDLSFIRPRLEETEFQAIRKHRLFRTAGATRLFVADIGTKLIQGFRTRRGALFVIRWRLDGYAKGIDGGRWTWEGLEEVSRDEMLRLVQYHRIEVTNPLRRALGL